MYGTFSFEGLEQSPQAGELNLMDMVSFRELYGFLTDDRKQGDRRPQGGGHAPRTSPGRTPRPSCSAPRRWPTPAAPSTADATPGVDPDAALSGLAGRLRREELASRVYDPKQLEQGVVLNAAVILHDPEKLEETIAAIEAAGAATGMPLKAISWQKASGIIGQFVTLARIVLNTAVLIIFVVALVIINNALVMATLERVQEIGTLRAVGAQRRFIVGMLVIESVVIGALFGVLGAAVGAGIVTALGRVGIPAANDVFTFFFSGPAPASRAGRRQPRRVAGHRAGGQRDLQLLSGLAGHAGDPPPGHGDGGVT